MDQWCNTDAGHLISSSGISFPCGSHGQLAAGGTELQTVTFLVCVHLVCTQYGLPHPAMGAQATHTRQMCTWGTSSEMYVVFRLGCISYVCMLPGVYI